jgi:hypothetical protein
MELGDFPPKAVVAGVGLPLLSGYTVQMRSRLAWVRRRRGVERLVPFGEIQNVEIVGGGVEGERADPFLRATRRIIPTPIALRWN